MSEYFPLILPVYIQKLQIYSRMANEDETGVLANVDKSAVRGPTTRQCRLGWSPGKCRQG